MLIHVDVFVDSSPSMGLILDKAIKMFKKGMVIFLDGLS